MDTDSTLALYPIRRCKIIHLVRHAQGEHNVAGEKDHAAYSKEEFFDAQLTSLGWKQVDELRKHVRSTGLLSRIELVITSPLTRTMETAAGVFGGEAHRDGREEPPIMAAKVGDRHLPAISSLGSPPFMAVELCREVIGDHPCDRRRSLSEYRNLFPAIDFSQMEHEDDVLWKPYVREDGEEVAERGMKFFSWLSTRKEKEVAIVTHSGFLYHTLNALSQGNKEISTNFKNCELRSIVVVDGRAILSNGATNG